MSYKNHIRSIGIELEGGISGRGLQNILDKYNDNRCFSYGYDGSVLVPCPSHLRQLRYEWMNNIELRYYSSNIDDVLCFVQYVFGLSFVQNETCGNHHHFKFKRKKYYGYLSDYDFMVCYLSYYKRFALAYNIDKYFKRFRSQYSQLFSSDFEAVNPSNRYYVFNTYSLFEKQKTIEIRIMPYADDAEEAINQIKFNYNVINQLLLDITDEVNIID